MGAAWAWHGKCKPNTAAVCKSNGKETIQNLSGTAWQGNGMGTAWARHRHGMGMAWNVCELAFSLLPGVAYSIPSQLPSIVAGCLLYLHPDGSPSWGNRRRLLAQTRSGQLTFHTICLEIPYTFRQLSTGKREGLSEI